MNTMSTMSTSAHAGRTPKGFTLVELMVVVVIIAILMGLLGAAFMATRTAARITVIKTEISQLETALENYKNEYSAYPPSFDYVNIVAERGGDAALQQAGRDAVMRHLRKAFPQYAPGRIRNASASPNPEGRPENDLFEAFANDVYYAYGGAGTIDPTRFDAASALVFWLGGLPETAATSGQWIPAGFYANPTFPFKPGLPRKAPLFTGFEPERIGVVESHYEDPNNSGSSPVPRFLRFYPPHANAPYVYFKSRRVNGTWHYGAQPTGGGVVQFSYQHAIVGEPLGNNCVPYRDPQNPPIWREHDRFQILAAGIDNEFGNRPVNQARVSKTGGNFSPNRGDFDNITNFSPRTLEDEIE